jgi:hypothetical protein
MNRCLFFFILLVCPFLNRAQTKGASYATIVGKVLSAKDFNPLEDAEISLPKLKLLTQTAPDGTFKLSHVPYGNFTLIIKNGSDQVDSVRLFADSSLVDIGILKVKNSTTSASINESRNPTIEVDGNSGPDDTDGPSDQSISGVLNAGRDPYVAAAAFTFSAYRYRIRGYNRDELSVYMNGMQMNDVRNGGAYFSQWGGLNDMFRDQSTTVALQANENGFGGLSGLTSINATAADQRQQTRLSYAASNRTYRNRIMASYAGGVMSNGWAFAFDVSKRWAKEGYVAGTSYNGYSYYLGISKKLSKKSMLSFTTFGAPTERGKAAPATQEADDLAGSHYYNPNWGYLNGEKVNSKMNRSYQPVYMLNYDYTPNSKTKLGLVASYQAGGIGNTSLDFYNAQDPRPDYYRYLPSYYETDPNTADPVAAAAVRQDWLNNPSVRQINWDRLHEANRLNGETFNGTSGSRSLYVIGEDREDTKKYSFAANLQKVVNEHLSLSAGILFISQQTNNYRKLTDLLGGDYFVNLNQFAERTYIGNTAFNQNDLNNPNGIVKEGDKYSYSYQSTFRKASGWAQLIYTQRKVDFFLAGKLGQDAFSRNGYYKSGLFPNDSYGKSGDQNFLSYQLKGGLTYKINGRNYLYANAAVMTAAPIFDNTFISPRTRNSTVNDPRMEKIKSIEGGYILHAPRLNGKISAFATDIDDATDIKRFYHDDYRTFVNYVMRNVNVRHIGGEIALQAKISPSFSATAVATWTQIFYTSNPDVSVFRDNDTSQVVNKTTSYLKNKYVAAGPQSAYTLGLNYRSPHYWYANVNFNYLNRNYVSLNPVRFTEDAVGLLKPQSPRWNDIVGQEELKGAFTVDLFAGKSFLLSKSMKWLPRGTYLYLNAGINNLLNNKNIQTSGFEQLRYDVANQNPERFPSKYNYAFGTNYFVNVSLKF